MPDPKIDKREDAAVGNRLQKGRPHMVRHACAVLKEVREPGGLHNPDKGDVQDTAGDGNRGVGPGDSCDGGKLFENGDFVLDPLDHLGVSEGRHELFAAIHLGDVLNFIRRQTWLHARQGKPVLFNQRLEVAAVGDEMNV